MLTHNRPQMLALYCHESTTTTLYVSQHAHFTIVSQTVTACLYRGHRQHSRRNHIELVLRQSGTTNCRSTVDLVSFCYMFIYYHRRGGNIIVLSVHLSVCLCVGQDILKIYEQIFITFLKRWDWGETKGRIY